MDDQRQFSCGTFPGTLRFSACDGIPQEAQPGLTVFLPLSAGNRVMRSSLTTTGLGCDWKHNSSVCQIIVEFKVCYSLNFCFVRTLTLHWSGFLSLDIAT